MVSNIKKVMATNRNILSILSQIKGVEKNTSINNYDRFRLCVKLMDDFKTEYVDQSDESTWQLNRNYYAKLLFLNSDVILEDGNQIINEFDDYPYIYHESISNS